MNLTDFFAHWKIEDNPFAGEEARHDAVFARMALRTGVDAHPQAAQHSDFAKIVGDIEHPSTSVVFGEKGSGKTAIRMQIAQRVHEINESSSDDRVFLIAYDDWNTFLDRMHEVAGKANALESLKKIRLVDHMDAILSLGVTSLVDEMLGERPKEAHTSGIDPVIARHPARLNAASKRDLLLLQAVYDRSTHAGERTARLRRNLRILPTRASVGWASAQWLGWLPAAGFVTWSLMNPPEAAAQWRWWVFAVLAGLFGIVLFKTQVWDRLIRRTLGVKLRKQVRSMRRAQSSFAASLSKLPESDRTPAVLPLTSTDDQRYAMFDRFRRVLRGAGCNGLLVLIDRLDEPTLINGDAERMKAAVWPLLNNKFLQQDGVGFKMLLPIELRHAIFRESSSFFQEVRLDKQNLVERLTWTGPMLYDLCDARLRACVAQGADPVSLQDLFEADVTRQDLVEALAQVHQPRDAFKMLYRCLGEHCSNVTLDQQAWRISKPVLDQVRKLEADRVQQLYRGVRPA